MPDSREVPQRILDLAAQLAQAKPMRRGSLSERYVKCSKPGCPCASDPDARHGPYFSLTRGVGGEPASRFVSAAQAELVRRQVQAGQHFRRQVEALLGSLRAMGQCPTGRSGGHFRGRPKKGLQTALEAEVTQEIEALLGREALAELDFEALEVALSPAYSAARGPRH